MRARRKINADARIQRTLYTYANEVKTRASYTCTLYRYCSRNYNVDNYSRARVSPSLSTHTGYIHIAALKILTPNAVEQSSNPNYTRYTPVVADFRYSIFLGYFMAALSTPERREPENSEIVVAIDGYVCGNCIVRRRRWRSSSGRP